MNCYQPGEMIVLPAIGGAYQTNAMLSESQYGALDIIYSVEDLLNYYHLDTEGVQSQFGAFPFVARVPEGEELDYANNYRMVSGINAAMPNFYIRPLSNEPAMNSDFLSQAFKLLDCRVRSPQCGKDVKIAVIDTGINPEILEKPSSLYKDQYSTDQKLEKPRGLAPFDPIGHGSTVAHIINKIAPASTILSIKMMERIGNIGGLLSAIYLAEAEFKPDIYNLSLSLTCNPDICEICGTQRSAMINSRQLRLLFELIDKRQKGATCNPLIVAAAGNNVKNISMPAIFPNALAVGSYDIVKENIADYSTYKSVPEDRFILAPGGSKEPDNCVARKPDKEWDRQGTFYGTSFSAAFVTGIAARYLCSTKESPCSQGKMEAGRDFLLKCLKRSAYNSLSNYMPETHGMGIVRYDVSILEEGIGRHFNLTNVSFDKLENDGIPKQVLNTLKCLENKEFTQVESFLNAIESQIGEEQTGKYKQFILKYASK